MSMLLLFFCWQHANQWKCWSKLWFPCRDLSICWIVHQKHNMNQIWHLCLLQCLDDIYVCMTVAQNVVEKWARPAWQLKNVSNSMGLAIAQVWPFVLHFCCFWKCSFECLSRFWQDETLWNHPLSICQQEWNIVHIKKSQDRWIVQEQLLLLKGGGWAGANSTDC